jgi:hypothetical protein
MGIAQESVATLERPIPVGEAAPVRSPEAEGQAAADTIASLLQRVAASSVDEIDRLIDEMTTMRHLLQTEAAGVQRRIITYAHLSQSAMRTAKSISESLARQKIDQDELELVLDDNERCRAATGLRPDGDVTPRPPVNEDRETAGLQRPKRPAQSKG